MGSLFRSFSANAFYLFPQETKRIGTRPRGIKTALKKKNIYIYCLLVKICIVITVKKANLTYTKDMSFSHPEAISNLHLSSNWLLLKEKQPQKIIIKIFVLTGMFYSRI